jgi:hypothetical protein
MRLFEKIISFLLVINYGLSIKTEDICSLANRQKVCIGKYSNKCGNHFCSVDTASCDKYLISTSQVVKFTKKSEPIVLFLNGIRKCASNDWIVKDVCKKSN